MSSQYFLCRMVIDGHLCRSIMKTSKLSMKNRKMYSFKRKGAPRSVMEIVETENFKGKPGTK